MIHQFVSKLFRAYGLYNSTIVGNVMGRKLFQSSFELTGYITVPFDGITRKSIMFQSSFELTGYITIQFCSDFFENFGFQSSFELTGYITNQWIESVLNMTVSKLFRAYGLYNSITIIWFRQPCYCFKALSSLRVI